MNIINTLYVQTLLECEFEFWKVVTQASSTYVHISSATSNEARGQFDGQKNWKADRQLFQNLRLKFGSHKGCIRQTLVLPMCASVSIFSRMPSADLIQTHVANLRPYKRTNLGLDGHPLPFQLWKRKHTEKERHLWGELSSATYDFYRIISRHYSVLQLTSSPLVFPLETISHEDRIHPSLGPRSLCRCGGRCLRKWGDLMVWPRGELL